MWSSVQALGRASSSAVTANLFANAAEFALTFGIGYLVINGWGCIDNYLARDECMEKTEAFVRERQTFDRIAEEYGNKARNDKWILPGLRKH